MGAHQRPHHRESMDTAALFLPAPLSERCTSTFGFAPVVSVAEFTTFEGKSLYMPLSNLPDASHSILPVSDNQSMHP